MTAREIRQPRRNESPGGSPSSPGGDSLLLKEVKLFSFGRERGHNIKTQTKAEIKTGTWSSLITNIICSHCDGGDMCSLHCADVIFLIWLILMT